ncbi:MAG TPA: beta-N-acetylhexosaminidase, partial [Jatrophihabitantaceae bacterium]
MMRWRPLSAVIALVAGLVVVAAPAGAGAAPTNPAPDVVPGLQQWTGSTGRFEFGVLSRIVVADPALLADARSFADDLRGVAGVQLPVVSGHSTHRGDIAIRLGASGLPAQGYALSIGDTVTIAGVDATGAFYAEQTVEQQVLQDGSLPRGEARDWPDVGQRGFMLDMGRHYYSPAYVEREIRTAAWHKLDVVHLHLTEYNAFRLQSSTYPGLAAAQSYSHADLSAFVATARRYHVTLVPEIDLPAHSTAIADFDPTLRFDCASLADGFTLDVTKPQTMQFLVGLLKEFMPLFPDSPVFHLGGDEYAGLAAQQACPELVDYAKAHGFGSTEDVFVDFLNKLGAQVQALGKRPEIWNWWDVVGGATISPDKNLIIDAWTGSPAAYLAAGYDTVSSPDNLLYVTPSSPPGGAIEPNDQYL